MTLLEFKDYIKTKKPNELFDYGISEPFSWRGSYNEVAFEILDESMSREEILENIQKAYDNTFIGYKGGEFDYDDYTPVNFEEGISRYTDGGYAATKISEIEGGEIFESQEMRLVKLAFK